MRGGSDAGLKQDDLFSLIEKFVWEYFEDEIISINAALHVSQFGKIAHCFFNFSYSSSIESKSNDSLENHIGYFDEGLIYTAHFNNKAHEHLDFSLTKSLVETENPTYFTFCKTYQSNYDLIIAFTFINSSTPVVYYGVALKHFGNAILKSAYRSNIFLMQFSAYKNNIQFTMHPYLSKSGFYQPTNKFEFTYGSSPYGTELKTISSKEEFEFAKKQFKSILNKYDLQETY